MRLPAIYAAFLMFWFVLASGLALFSQEGPGKDGQYHDPDTGEVQPATCNNSYKNEHPCDCTKANAKCDGTGGRCKTYCRPKACGCANGCTS